MKTLFFQFILRNHFRFREIFFVYLSVYNYLIWEIYPINVSHQTVQINKDDWIWCLLNYYTYEIQCILKNIKRMHWSNHFRAFVTCLTKIILFVTYKQRKTAAYNEITPNENKKIINIFIISTKINKKLFIYDSNIG